MASTITSLTTLARGFPRRFPRRLPRRLVPSATKPPTTTAQLCSFSCSALAYHSHPPPTPTSSSSSSSSSSSHHHHPPLPSKSADPSKWYSTVLARSGMLDYHDVSGCYILRPWSYAIWSHLQTHLNARLASSGVDNCYFPMFVTPRALSVEQSHVEGFAPEVAWVTKAGQADLAQPLAIRPTSETIMYPAFARWIQSYRDLPLRLNQWCNVVRWEFKHPQPLLRSREFLWQEGHSAFATRAEADKEVREMLGYYQDVYEDLLAVPVIAGRKSTREQFAGALYTTTVEAFIPATGRAIQGATSHALGQNFARMFDIKVATDSGAMEHVWQTSWGLTTRTLGVMVLVHGDDKGLVLPPKVAAVQVVVVPCGLTAKLAADKRAEVMRAVDQVVRELTRAGVRVKADTRDHVSPGYKFNDWELKGVPLRVEVGPRDVVRGQVVAVRRDQVGVKHALPLDAGFATAVEGLMEDMHRDMFERAKRQRDAHVVVMDGGWESGRFMQQIARGMVMAPWCGSVSCEEKIKEVSAAAAASKGDQQQDERAPTMGAKSLCIPFDQPREVPKGTKCFAHGISGCGKDAVAYGLFGRSH